MDIVKETSRMQKAKKAFLGQLPNIRNFAIFSPENPMGRSLSESENKELRVQFEDLLHRGHFNYFPIKGKYGNIEHSYFVYNVNVDDVMRWGSSNGFNQESFFICESLYDEEARKTGVKFNYYKKDGDNKPFKFIESSEKWFDETSKDITSDKDDYFSVVGKNFKFSIGMDEFGNLNEANGKLELVKEELGDDEFNRYLDDMTTRSGFNSWAKRGKFSAIMKKQIVNETIDGSIKSIIQLKTLDRSLEFAQMFDALNDCPSDFQGKLIQVLNSIGETIKVSPVEVFNIVLCANEEDDTRKKLYNWWRGLFEILSKCEIPDDRKSEYDEKVDALIAEISKAGDNAQVNESEEVGYEQANKEDEDVMLKEMEFAISKIGEIANKVQDLINFVNPYCESNEVINTMKNESKSRQARRDAMFDKIESLGYVINEAPYGWEVELGDELKKEYEEKMGGIKSYLPDYLKLDIWSSAISARHPREDMRGFFFDNGDGSIGYPRAFNHWLNCPARKELRERFDIEKLEDGAKCPDGSCGKGGVWLNESVLDVKKGDVVDWFDPEDERVYHGFTVTKVFAKNGMAEISNDDEGVFVVGINELEPGEEEPVVESGDAGLDMIEKEYVLGIISKQAAIRKLDALFQGDEIKTNEEIANFTTLKHEYENLMDDATEGMLDASDVIEFLVDRDIMDYAEAKEYVEEELELNGDYEYDESARGADEWVSMDSIIGENDEEVYEPEYHIGDKVIWDDPDGDQSDGWVVSDIQSTDEDVVYVINNPETGSEAEVLEGEIYLDDTYKVQAEAKAVVDVNTVWDVLELIKDEQAKDNLKKLITSKVRGEDDIMAAIEGAFADSIDISELDGYLADCSGLVVELGLDVDKFKASGEFVDADAPTTISESDADLEAEYLEFVGLLKNLKDATIKGFNDGDDESKVEVVKKAIETKDSTTLNRLLVLANANGVGEDNPVYKMIDSSMESLGESGDEVKGHEKKFKSDDGSVKVLDNAGKKVVSEMTIEQEINSANDLLPLLWGRAKVFLQELIDNSGHSDEEIMEWIEGLGVNNLSELNDLLSGKPNLD